MSEASPAPLPLPHMRLKTGLIMLGNGVASKIQDGMARLFDLDRTHIETWPSIRDIDCSWYWGRSTRIKASPLYYAALCGIGSLVEYLPLDHASTGSG
jgi:hypothetical protein